MAASNTPPPKPPGIDPNVSPATNQGSSGVSQLVDQIIQDEQIGSATATGIVRGGINGILGGEPVAERNQEYFAVIKEVGDTSPEIIDKSQFKVIYLCDSQLNVSKPSKDSVALSNINQNFGRQSNAIVRVDQGTALNPQLAGSHNIHAVGSIEPILGTQIGKGPLAYVTTMSFVQEGQLGADPGRTVAQYYMWLNKSVGFQNVFIANQNSGDIVFRYAPGGYNDWGPQEELETPYVQAFNQTNAEFTSGVNNGFRLYHDEQQYPYTGSAVEQGTDTDAGNPGSVPTDFDSSKYFNKITILTGSLEGNTRIKVNVAIGVSVETSSIHDIWASRYSSNQSNGAQGGFGQGVNSRYGNVILKIYRERSGEKEQIGRSQTLTLDFYNDKVSYSNIDTTQMARWRFGQTVYDAGDFWRPDNGKYTNLKTDYFDVEQYDKIYAEIELPQENTSSDGVYTNEFTESLKEYKDKAAYRLYRYFGGSIIVSQETPAGQEFINDVTGVTASYYTSEGSASVYNYSASYWVGYNNYSSSTEGIGSYITSSTALANFYGGEYIQANPGTETYNVINAEFSPSSSLGVGDAKKTWNKFGFNPIRLPFVLTPGDMIRFEYAPTKVYEIKRVIASGNVIKLQLNGQLDESTVFDNFVIYRIIQDGQYIILDVKKNNEAGIDQAFTGIITPEYPSENLKANADQLIFQLKQANIIET